MPDHDDIFLQLSADRTTRTAFTSNHGACAAAPRMGFGGRRVGTMAPIPEGMRGLAVLEQPVRPADVGKHHGI